jgi:hypothetical protein
MLLFVVFFSALISSVYADPPEVVYPDFDPVDNIGAMGVSASQINVGWSPSLASTEPAYYNIYRNNTWYS